MLEEAGLAEPYVNDDGKPAIRLTARGAALGRAIAKSGDTAHAVGKFDALLDELRRALRQTREQPAGEGSPQRAVVETRS